jgi:hypothetical protein
MTIKELWISITKKNPTNTSKIPIVLDVLSPIESSCSSPEQIALLSRKRLGLQGTRVLMLVLIKTKIRQT